MAEYKGNASAWDIPRVAWNDWDCVFFLLQKKSLDFIRGGERREKAVEEISGAIKKAKRYEPIPADQPIDARYFHTYIFIDEEKIFINVHLNKYNQSNHIPR